MKRFDLMMGINTRGTFMVSKYCIPHLKKAENPHILMLSPPLDMKTKWFEDSTAYTMAKFGMSMCVLGLSGELNSAGVAVNALWPRTTIATAAVGNLLGGDAMMRASRTPEIMGDAAHVIFTKPARDFTGQFCIDDKVLYDSGVRDFERYRVDPSVAADVGFLRARRRRAAARRHREGAAVGWRGPEVALTRSRKVACDGSISSLGAREHGMLSADRVRAALFKRAVVGGTGVNAIQKRHRPRMALIEAGARGGGFERKTHLDVGGGEVVAGEPFVLAEFAFPIRHMLLELRIDQRRSGPGWKPCAPAGAATPARASAST